MPYKILIICVAISSGISYCLMCLDKYRSKNRGQRISENTWIVMALLFGAIGIYLGMQAPLYHKAAKPKFRIGIPLLILVNLAMVCAIALKC